MRRPDGLETGVLVMSTTPRLIGSSTINNHGSGYSHAAAGHRVEGTPTAAFR